MIRRRDRFRLIDLLAAGLIAPRLPGTVQVDCAVSRNAVQPGPEVGARFEPPELPVRTQEAFLHHVLGILFVAGQAEREGEERSAVPLHQRAKRLAITLTGPRQNGGGLGRVHLHN